MLPVLVSIVGTTTSVRDARRDALREIHARQRTRRHEQGREPVDERDRELAGRNHRKDDETARRQPDDAVAVRDRPQVAR